ncbi:MAG: SurA N-terminal domain-containing protein, partial [Terriglobia bacterium]|nr:SurA N-terminal domain-containing protein [Terriglobia bacterium]
MIRGLLLLGCLLGNGIGGGSQAQTPSHRIAMLDRVVADVDGQAILASDVDDEIRFSALQPGVEPAEDNTPQRALNRVIDRTLIDQQRALQPGVAVVSQKDVDQAIATMRKQISAATNMDCEADAGWKAYLAQHGFTPDEIQERMQERLAILKFIDVRFGVVVQVSNADVRNYYDQVLTPELRQSKQPLPDFRTVAPKIRQILRQRQVSKLIDEWLKSLRAEGHVQILDAAYLDAGSQGEVLPK